MKTRKKKIVTPSRGKPLGKKQYHVLSQVELAVGELQELDERIDDAIGELTSKLALAKRMNIKLSHTKLNRNKLFIQLSDLEMDVDELVNPPHPTPKRRH